MNSIRTIRSLSKGYRHARRYHQMLGILVKNGFGFLFENLAGKRLLQFLHLSSKENINISLQEGELSHRLISTLVELGPTFVKLGQMLSCRPDLLPDELLLPLSQLQSNVPAFEFQDVRKIIQEEFGQPLEAIFQEFDQHPSGSASIAQGHRAILKDGQQVFVKIQRPGITQKIQVDLEILATLADYLEQSIPELSILNPRKIVEEFKNGFLEELDFRNEAANIRAFQRQFSSEANLVIPEPVNRYCSRRILTMSYIDGTPGSSIASSTFTTQDQHALAQLGVDLLLRQIFTFGFFHGDPHPGNLIFLPGPKLAYVDFGIMGRLTINERTSLKKIIAAFYFNDLQEMAQHVAELSLTPDAVDIDGLERELSALVSTHLHGNIRELNVVQFSTDFFKICYRQHLCLKPHFCRMIRALGYADAMGRKLAPDFNILETLRPFVLKESLNRFNPPKKLREAMRCLNKWEEFVQQTPGLSLSILHQLKEGKLLIAHKQDDIRVLADNVKKGSVRLSSALILSTLLLSSVLFILFHVPPLLFGMSAIGTILFAVSLFCAILTLKKQS